MPTQNQRNNRPAPGASEFSHGPGLSPPGVTRYCGTAAGDTVSESMTPDAVRAIARLRRGQDD